MSLGNTPLLTPSLLGWKAFPTPTTLTNIMNIWALSPMMPQVMGVSTSPLCAHDDLGIPYGEMRDNIKDKKMFLKNTIYIFNFYLCSIYLFMRVGVLEKHYEIELWMVKL